MAEKYSKRVIGNNVSATMLPSLPRAKMSSFFAAFEMSRCILTAFVLLGCVSCSLGLYSNCQPKEGGGCSVFCQCAEGLQCEAGTHVCKKAGKEGERCHLTRHCGDGLYCRPLYHTCQRMGEIGERCVSGFNSAEGKTRSTILYL